jgi:hypothetical protein
MHQMRISTNSLFSDAQVEQVGNLGTKNVNCKRARKGKKQTQCHEIELHPSNDIAVHEGNNPSF